MGQIIQDKRRATTSEVTKGKEIPTPEHRLPQFNIMEKAVLAAEGAFRRHFLDIERMLTKKGGADSAYIQESVDNLTQIVGTELYNTKKPVILAPESLEEIPDEGGCWLLNPIVARRNFAASRMPTGIRMVYMKDGKPGAVMLALPTTHEVFHAEKGQGATGRTRLRVSGEKDINQLDVFAFIGEQPETKHKMSDILSVAEKNSFNLLISGCFAYSVCEVAAGKADALIGKNLTVGEIAFATLMIKESGGIIKDINGDNATMKSTDVIVGSSRNVKSILDIL
jgi:fructose-1,6-bisphosphatase/inositol monophosphatase family enzyme